MNTAVVRPDPAAEFETPERCFILEAWNDEQPGGMNDTFCWTISS